VGKKIINPVANTGDTEGGCDVPSMEAAAF
jgi:hypothetical protein